MEFNAQEVKRIVKEELPGLMRRDKEIRQFILQLSREQLAAVREKTGKLEKETESRFDRLLDELRRDREEQSRKWEENQKEIKRLYKTINRKHDTTLGALGSRWGLRTEASFRNALKDILKDFNIKVLNIEEYDDKGEVFDRPDNVELDIIIVNGRLFIGEIKSSMSRADIFLFYRKVKFYERIHDRKAEGLFVISPMVEPRAQELSKELGIKVYSHADEMGEELAKEL